MPLSTHLQMIINIAWRRGRRGAPVGVTLPPDAHSFRPTANTLVRLIASLPASSETVIASPRAELTSGTGIRNR